MDAPHLLSNCGIGLATASWWSNKNEGVLESGCRVVWWLSDFCVQGANACLLVGAMPYLSFNL